MNSQFIRDQIDGIAADRRIAYVHTLAARMAVGQLEGQARAALLNFRGGEDLANPANTVGTILSFARSDAGRDLAAARIVLNLLEASPEFAEAATILNPLHQELAEAVEREAAEAHDERLALAAVEAAEQAAREKLAAKVQADPAVQRAKADLSKIRRLGEPLDLATV
jgi:prophage DNA circulation protein